MSEQSLIEVLNIDKVSDQPSLIATCDVRIIAIKYTLVGVRIFEKGASRWIGVPAQKITAKDGTVKYMDTGRWDTDQISRKFRDAVMLEFDKHVAKNGLNSAPFIEADAEHQVPW